MDKILVASLVILGIAILVFLIGVRNMFYQGFNVIEPEYEDKKEEYEMYDNFY